MHFFPHFLFIIDPSHPDLTGLLNRSCNTRMADLGQRWVRLAPNGTNSGLSQITFQYILARRAKIYGNVIWKSPGFVSFGANLTNFGPKSGPLDVTQEQQLSGFMWFGCTKPGIVNNESFPYMNKMIGTSILSKKKHYNLPKYIHFHTIT